MEKSGYGPEVGNTLISFAFFPVSGGFGKILPELPRNLR
jgi:hypothetical protein